MGRSVARGDVMGNLLHFIDFGGHLDCISEPYI